jgi:hypothetical protein
MGIVDMGRGVGMEMELPFNFNRNSKWKMEIASACTVSGRMMDMGTWKVEGEDGKGNVKCEMRM